MIAAAVGFAALFTLMFLGMPIAFAMGIVGVFGFAQTLSLHHALILLGQTTFDTAMNETLLVIPLFLLMGNIVSRSGMADGLYQAAHCFLGHRSGGLAVATVVAAGGFSTICGSSLATAVAVSRIALPAMRKRGYDIRLATGSIAAGGTLGILIPPSNALVIYGSLVEGDIGKLFIAALIPGVLGIICYALAVIIVTRINPRLGPRSTRSSWHERLMSLRGIWGVLMLFVLVIGGIYFGVFTPTEAAGIGAAGALLFSMARRVLSIGTLVAALVEAGRTTAMIFFLLIGAMMFSHFLEIAGAPTAISGAIKELDVSPISVILIIMAVYIVLGCVLESISMILLTIPIFYPVVVALGFDPVWFGILVVVVIEISLITPPIGMNVYLISSINPGITVGTVFRGVTPFILADIVRLGLLVAFPQIVLFLPGVMK